MTERIGARSARDDRQSGSPGQFSESADDRSRSAGPSSPPRDEVARRGELAQTLAPAAELGELPSVIAAPPEVGELAPAIWRRRGRGEAQAGARRAARGRRADAP